MVFSHFDKSNTETLISLHDCIAESSYFENGSLCFEFSDGFWVLPEHPENCFGSTVKTDLAKAEFPLEKCNGFDVGITVYLFKDSMFKKVIRTELSIEELLERINRKKCKLEFLYQYTDGFERLLHCELISGKRPYRQECWIKLPSPKVLFHWNNLLKDRTW